MSNVVFFFLNIVKKNTKMRKVHSCNTQIPPGQYQYAQSPQNIRFETKPFLAFWIYVALLCSWEDTSAEIQPAPSWHSFLISFAVWEKRQLPEYSCWVKKKQKPSLSPGTERWSLHSHSGRQSLPKITVMQYSWQHTHHIWIKRFMNASQIKLRFDISFFLCCLVRPCL